jgi:hypothetical protein
VHGRELEQPTRDAGLALQQGVTEVVRAQLWIEDEGGAVSDVLGQARQTPVEKG